MDIDVRDRTAGLRAPIRSRLPIACHAAVFSGRGWFHPEAEKRLLQLVDNADRTDEEVFGSFYVWLTGIALPPQERVDALNEVWLASRG